MLGIVVSRADSASEHVGDHLLEIAEWDEHSDDGRPGAAGGGTVYRSGRWAADAAEDDRDAPIELREFDALHLETEGVADAFGRVAEGPERSPDLLVFASRHAGETGPLLTAHHTGNVGPAEFGGADGALARACPNAHRRVLAALADHAPPGYEVGMECTHHGPTEVGVPSTFVEVGSDEPQWEDPEAARAVAMAILSLRGVAPDAPLEDGSRRHLVGIGGGHYAPRFERVVRETDWAVGHVAPDWGLEAMGHPREHREVIAALFEESAASLALVDGDHPAVEAVVEDLGYETVRETWLRETTGVPLELVDRLEERLGPVEAGLRTGDRATGFEGSFDVVSLPTALLEAAESIDREATRDVVEGATLAFETRQNGTRLDAAGRAAVAEATDRDALVDALADVLRPAYETVERAEGSVLARERAFDPERARDLGVPEGPKFGVLSAGQSVEADGETVHPEDVHVERERRFPVDGA